MPHDIQGRSEEQLALPLMPKATAVWLVESTTLTFDQIAAFCGLHPLEVAGIADDEVAIGIQGLDPVTRGQLTRDEIAASEADPERPLELAAPRVVLPPRRASGPRYTPVSKRQDRPNAIAWLLRFHPELSDAQLSRLVGTTKPTISAIRDRTHWNITNIRHQDPVSLGLCTQTALDEAVTKARARDRAKEEREAKVAAKARREKEIAAEAAAAEAAEAAKAGAAAEAEAAEAAAAEAGAAEAAAAADPEIASQAAAAPAVADPAAEPEAAPAAEAARVPALAQIWPPPAVVPTPAEPPATDTEPASPLDQATESAASSSEITGSPPAAEPPPQPAVDATPAEEALAPGAEDRETP